MNKHELTALAGRVEAAHEQELLILKALDDAYQGGRMEYLHYSPARDVTEARLAALSWSAAALRSQAQGEGGSNG